MTALTFVAESAEHSDVLPFADWIFGAIALVIFLLLLGITWSFRNTAQKIGQVSTHTVGRPEATAPHEPGTAL